MTETYGYIRVSSTDQNESRQRSALEQQGIPSGHIFMDKMSGKDFQRPQYQAMLKKLRPRDQLCITSIDRLGRNYEEILEQWRAHPREKRVDILVLDMPLLISFYRYFPLWPRTSGRTSAAGRPKALQRPNETV